MAIIVNGTALRTLSQPIYVNGTQIKAGYFNGTLCYPEDLPKGRYVLQLSGKMTQAFQTSEITKFGGYSWFYGYSNTKFERRVRSMAGTVLVTVVSTKPIAVFNADIPIATGDLTSEFGGQVGEYSGGGYYTPTGDGHTQSFPTMHANVGYQLSYGTNTGGHGDTLSDCTADAHVSFVIWGSNTALAMNKHETGTLSIASVYPDDPRTSMAWYAAQNKEYVGGYHGVRTGNEHGLSASSISYGGGYVDGILGYPDWYYFLIACGLPSKQEIRPDGSAHASPAHFLSLVNSSAICGYRLRVGVPCISSPLYAAQRDGTFTRTICWVPFTEVLYNNNPPISSPTFGTDPPTKEASDDLKVELSVGHPGLRL